MAAQLRIAVLECDTPIQAVSERHGTYCDCFTRLLQAGATGQDGFTPKQDVELLISKWDVVNTTHYPQLDDVDAVLLSGSSEYPRDHVCRTIWI
jgi:GMP synthase (glutamine-hydrolysing)